MMGIVILGATGSIGQQTLAVCTQYQEHYRVVGVSAEKNWESLLKICMRVKPLYAVLMDENAAEALRTALVVNKISTKVFVGEDALRSLAELPEADCVVAGISGSAGLSATFRAVVAGKKILLANKEVMVMAGELVMATANKSGARIVPIDSEHSAVFQCLPEHAQHSILPRSLTEVILTASGGPFLRTPLQDFLFITPELACDHPNWKMGKKVSIDSATMMNKGLELIEAKHLFNLQVNQLDAIIHPQSIIHALIGYCDGSMIAQLAMPDMRLPIAYGLAYPNRLALDVPRITLSQIGRLEFEEIDFERYPAFKLAKEVLQSGGSSAITLNAANEIAVAAFMAEQIPFTAIAEIIARVLELQAPERVYSLGQISDLDATARHFAQLAVKKLQH